MNFTARLNKLLVANGVTVAAEYCKAVRSYAVDCTFTVAGVEKTVCLSGVCRWRITDKRTAAEKAAAAAAEIIADLKPYTVSESVFSLV